MASSFEPLNTVIIPVYNGADYLREAINSVINQTYRNIEILVVDDGSNDSGETQRVLRGFGSRIRIISQQNGGTATALNTGFNNAQGEFLHWLSHDDLYLPDKVGDMMSALKKETRRHETILLSGWYFIDENRIMFGQKDPQKLLPFKLRTNPYWLILLAFVNGCTICIPKKLWLKTGLFRTDLPTTQDYEYWLRLLPKSNIRLVSPIQTANRTHSMQGSLQIKGHQNEADSTYLATLLAIRGQYQKLLQLSDIICLLRIEEHLKPSIYEKSKDFVSREILRIAQADIGVEKTKNEQLFKEYVEVNRITMQKIFLGGQWLTT